MKKACVPLALNFFSLNPLSIATRIDIEKTDDDSRINNVHGKDVVDSER